MQRCKRILSLVLACLLILSCFPAFASFSYDYTVSGSKLDIYVRVFVPIDPSSSWVGHYDMMIRGRVRIGSKTFTDPCFSYGEASRFYIFSESDTASVYRGKHYNNCRAYTIHFTVRNKAKLGTFLKYLSNTLASAKTAPKCSRALLCTFKSTSMFSLYSAATINCFTAVATWLKGFGNSSLWKVYKNAYKGGTSYLPVPFVRHYYSKLMRIK